MSVVVDSSVVLALIWDEPGAEGARPRIEGGRLSAVNLSETVAKLGDHGLDPDEAEALIGALPLSVAAFDHAQARLAGRFRAATRRAGLSLADRACLALAAAEGLTALTADRAWARVEIGVPVELIR